MKRGVFLLILNFVDDNDTKKKQKKLFSKKKLSNSKSEFKRYSLNVNGKNAIVLDLTEKDLHNDDILMLLKIYKGRVLVSTEYQNNSILNDYIFNPREYYQRALLSSLINQMKTVNKEWKTVCLKIESFNSSTELYELVKISKRVNIITNQNALTDSFTKACYYEYGAVITFKDITTDKFDVFLNLDEIDDRGRLMINAGSKEYLLYSAMKYFEFCSEYQKLSQYNIEHNIICSAFSGQ